MDYGPLALAAGNNGKLSYFIFHFDFFFFLYFDFCILSGGFS